jgi:hypothetical protein
MAVSSPVLIKYCTELRLVLLFILLGHSTTVQVHCSPFIFITVHQIQETTESREIIYMYIGFIWSIC